MGGPGGFGDPFGGPMMGGPENYVEPMNYFFDDPSLYMGFFEPEFFEEEGESGEVEVQDLEVETLLLVLIMLILKINQHPLMHGNLMVSVVMIILKGVAVMIYFLEA